MLNLRDPAVYKLLTQLKKRPRAEGKSVGAYIDSGSNLEQIQLSRHTVVFGRRGSGKTTLLAELRKHAESAKDGVVWIDIDDYKSLTYPDVLIQVLRSLFASVGQHVARKNPLWRPIKWWKSKATRKSLAHELDELSTLLQRFEESEAQLERSHGTRSTRQRQASIGVDKYIDAKLTGARNHEASADTKETTTGKDRKIDRIRRHLHDAKVLLQTARAVSYEKYFLILDDFYHLTIDDQAKVLDYLHSLSKNNAIYIKFGTIAHRSSLYHRGETLIEGMQKEHDVLAIDLDRTFQNFQEVEEFIKRFWEEIKKLVEGGEDLDTIFAGESWRQLVLATGGVPRDFMNILARSIELGQSHKKDRLDVFTINEAANLYLRETKYVDLLSDKIVETNELEGMLADIRDFCVTERKRNLFLIDKDDLDKHAHQRELLRQLLDFRFIHLVHSNTSAASHAGRFEAYMLDVGLYAHPQRRGENRVSQVDFLTREDQHRQDAIRTQPIYRLKEAYGQTTVNVFAEPTPELQTQMASEPDSVAKEDAVRDGQQYLLRY
jgi:Cdc6-like AAA superfamily ATPase